MVKRIIALLVACIYLWSFVHAELIIGKRVNGNFVALKSSDQKLFKSAYKVLATYQWPMCLAHVHTFSKQEKKSLFSSTPYAEEDFIRNKIQQIDKNLDLIFVPTTMYELFCYLMFFKNLNQTGKSSVYDLTRSISNQFALGEFDSFYHQAIAQRPVYAQRRLSFDFYAQFNESLEVQSFAFLMHQQLASFLINHVAGCARPATSGAFAQKIKEHSSLLTQDIIDQLVTISYSEYNFQKLKKELDKEKKLKSDGMVAKAIELEYKARSITGCCCGEVLDGVSQCIKALQPTNKLKNISNQLLDSALRAYSLQDFITLIRAYTEKAFEPLPSYGNSLFAAYFIRLWSVPLLLCLFLKICLRT